MTETQPLEASAEPMSEHAVRERLMNDPDTKEFAEILGVEVDEYIDKVVRYAMNPNSDPEMYVIEDEDLRRVLEVDAEQDEREILAWLQMVADGTIELDGSGDQFAAQREARKKLAAMEKAAGVMSSKTAPSVESKKGSVVVDNGQEQLGKELLLQKFGAGMRPRPSRPAATGRGRSKQR